ncbi:unnamed protein product [Darwinula stevensoni]|uniref:Vesicle tethering protein Uso1/P115-like head domain-containing protein n=1 Tax=Darwinula stevensoni TaxID=69355 RepID=A0A7R9A8D7_9CRUS|nr:unnamed protein product [Darwinula stevensoni]CAG0896328.1 unnamed protein product [Darwinula stevensoni]
MELFRGFRSVLTNPAPGNVPTGAETVERLINRIQSSTLLEDRRDACRALKALSRKYRMEVGAQGMNVLINVLATDRGDAEIIGYALDTLCNVMSPVPFEEEEGEMNMPRERLADLGERFTEIFIKRVENVSLLLGLLEEFDFHVRWPAVKLITNLITNRAKELQECILVSPMGVSRLMDLLSDSREVIRNDGLLLLHQLTKGNANIQKIVAFENAFDRLLDVVTEEGYSEGGIVVEDCLLVLLNLLKNNPSNQTFFKEGSYIQRLAPFFCVLDTDLGWSAQKVSNFLLMLQIVRTLVKPGNASQVVHACQSVMLSCGLLKRLCSVLMASGVPADVLSEIINAVAEIIWGFQNAQDFFHTVMAPSNPPRHSVKSFISSSGVDWFVREALLILLMSMVNERQPFQLRLSVLYCLQGYLTKNESAQRNLIATLLPSVEEQSENKGCSMGQLLMNGLFSSDPFTNWLSAVSLCHAVVDNNMQKEQLIRVHLALTPEAAPVSLMQQLSAIIQSNQSAQARMGVLMLLCMWLSHCPPAVSHFLIIPNSVSHLIAQVSSTEGDENEDLIQAMCAFLLALTILFNDNSNSAYTQEQLIQLIKKRIGTEKFLDKMTQVGRHESYARVVKSPIVRYHNTSEILLDHSFCNTFRSLESVALRVVGGGRVEEILQNGSHLKETPAGIEAQYKETLMHRDAQLAQVQLENAQLREQNGRLQAQVETLSGRVNQLLSSGVSALHISTAGAQAEMLNQLRNVNDYLQEQVRERDDHISELMERLRNHVEVSGHHQQADLQEQQDGRPSDDTQVLQQEIASLRQQLQERAMEPAKEYLEQLTSLQEMLQQRDATIANLHSQQVDIFGSQQRIKEAEEQVLMLQQQLKERDDTIAKLYSQPMDELSSQLQHQIKESKDQIVMLEQELKERDATIANLESQGSINGQPQMAEYEQKIAELEKSLQLRDAESQHLQQQVGDLQKQISDQQRSLKEKDAQISVKENLESQVLALQRQVSILQMSERDCKATLRNMEELQQGSPDIKSLQQEIGGLQQQVTVLQQQVRDRDSEIETSRQKTGECEQQVLYLRQQLQQQDAGSRMSSDVLNLRNQLEDLDEKNTALRQQLRERDGQIATLQANRPKNPVPVVPESKKIADLVVVNQFQEARNRALEEQLSRLSQDQDNLVELMTEYEGKLAEYRRRLNDLGQEVADDLVLNCDLGENLDDGDLEEEEEIGMPQTQSSTVKTK